VSRNKSSFHPSFVPEIRAGYFWLPKDTVNVGLTSFRILEGNKNSTFDQTQTTVAKQPSLISNNGNQQLSYVGAIDVPGSDVRTITSTDVVAGWTGNTYLGFWHKFPVTNSSAPGDLPSGATTLFNHNKVAPNRRWSFTHSGTDDTYSLTVSADGTALLTDKWDASSDYPSASDNPWLWKELILTVGIGVQLFIGFVLRSQTVTAINISSLSNSTASIAIYSSALSGINQNAHQGGPIYYGNGIPSLKNRKRLANYLNPRNVKFQI